MRRVCLALLLMATADAFSSLRAADEPIPRVSAMSFGGSGYAGGRAIATDTAGNVYVAGSISGRGGGIPATGVSVMKLNAAGSVQWAIGVGGIARDVAIGPDGAAYVLASRLALGDVFLAKVTPAGSIASTTNIPGLTMNRNYGQNEHPSIAVTPSGTVVVAGRSDSGGISGVPQTTIGPAGGEDAVVAFIDPRGVLTSSLLVGGSDADAAADVTVDASGNIYLVGRTRSQNFPVAGPAVRPPAAALNCRQSSVVLDNCDNAFIVTLDARGGLTSATFYGGSQADWGTAVGVAGNGDIYVAGFTSSRDFPTVHAVQPVSPSCPPITSNVYYGCSNGFVMRLDRAGASIAFATYFGGTASTTIHGMSVDRFGNVYVVGENRGNDLPVLRASQPDNGSGPLILSEDGGRTWFAAQGIRANTVGSPAWSGGGRGYVGTDRGLFVTADYGRHWTELPGFSTRSVGVVGDPVAPPIVYAVDATEYSGSLPPGRPGGLFKSLDGGQSWTLLNGPNGG